LHDKSLKLILHSNIAHSNCIPIAKEVVVVVVPVNGRQVFVLLSFPKNRGFFGVLPTDFCTQPLLTVFFALQQWKNISIEARNCGIHQK
jgi:hypothetical protein